MIFEKYSISAFTGKKKIIKKYSIVIFLIKFEFKKNLRVIEITTSWAKSAQKLIISTAFTEVAETMIRIYVPVVGTIYIQKNTTSFIHKLRGTERGTTVCTRFR